MKSIGERDCEIERYNNPILINKEVIMKSQIFLIVVLFNFIVAIASAQENEFFDAVITGDLEFVEILISKGTNVNAVDNRGGSALLLASENGHTEIAKLLIAKRADVNAVDNFGNTALMFASSRGHTKIAELLIEKGADLNARNDNRKTALWIAIEKRHTEIAKLLIAKGIDVNAVDSTGDTALMEASNGGHTEIVELLNKEIRTEKILVIILIVLLVAILILLFKGKAINKRIGYKISGVLAIVLYAVFVLLEILLINANTVENILRIIERVLIVFIWILLLKGEAIDKQIKYRISNLLSRVLVVVLIVVWVWITFFY